MSRSGYSYDGWDSDGAAAMWAGWVANAFRSFAGRAFLRELIAALDAMPVKELIAGEIEQDGQVCALGAVARRRGLSREALPLDVSDYEAVAEAFALSEYIVREVVDKNDDGGGHRFEIVGPMRPGLPRYGWRDDTPAERWQRMRDWAQGRLDRAEAYWTRRTMERLRKDLMR